MERELCSYSLFSVMTYEHHNIIEYFACQKVRERDLRFYEAFRHPFSPVYEFRCNLFESKMEQNKGKGVGMEKRQKVEV